MKKYGIIFDCDGTLVDSLGSALESFNYALEKIGEAPRTEVEIKRYFGAAADRIFTRLLGDETLGLRAFKHYLDHQSELAQTTKLHAGVRELLNRLRELEVPLGIVTGRHADDLEVVIKPHALHEYFVTMIGDSQLPNSKPAPDGILLAAQKMRLQPSHTLYVGDSPTDVKAAHNAGSTAVAALWDRLARREELGQELPRFFAETPAEIEAIFREFRKEN